VWQPERRDLRRPFEHTPSNPQYCRSTRRDELSSGNIERLGVVSASGPNDNALMNSATMLKAVCTAMYSRLSAGLDQLWYVEDRGGSFLHFTRAVTNSRIMTTVTEH
jgi:hypothetical protein